MFGSSSFGELTFGAFFYGVPLADLLAVEAAVLFNLTPEFEYAEEAYHKTRSIEFEAGVSQRSAVWPHPRRIFRLKWVSAVQSEKEYLASFNNEHQGPAGAFTYQPQDPIPSPAGPGTPGVEDQVVGAYGGRTYYYQYSWHTVMALY